MKSYFAIALVGLCASSYAQFSDDFNRADSVDLGVNWDVIGTGSATRTISNQAGNVAGANNLSLVKTSVFTGAYDGTVVSADFSLTDTTTSTAYVALALGHDGSLTSGHGLFIKIQRQAGTSTGGFTNYGFYTAVGSNNTTAVTGGGGNFTTLTSEVFTGRMSVWCSDPTTVNLGIDTDLNGTYEQLYTRTLSVAGGFVAGNRVGVGVFGAAGRMDNFNASPVPEPASLIVVGAGLLAIARRRRARR